MLVLGGGVGGPAEVVLVRLQLSVHGLQQHLVGGLAGDEAGLVHQGHDANVRLVDQAADDLRRNIYNCMGFTMIASKRIFREYLCLVAVAAVNIVVVAAVDDIVGVGVVVFAAAVAAVATEVAQDSLLFAHLVVEVVHVDPLDPLPLVLLLLLLEHQLDEELLQVLVAVVDAELLEGVVVEDLEAVDVEDADHRRVAVVAGLGRDRRVDGRVHVAHDPRKGIF